MKSNETSVQYDLGRVRIHAVPEVTTKDLMDHSTNIRTSTIKYPVHIPRTDPE